MKQMEVTILGQSYILACPEGGERALLEAVATVDREMSAIRDAGKVSVTFSVRGMGAGAHEVDGVAIVPVVGEGWSEPQGFELVHRAAGAIDIDLERY